MERFFVYRIKVDGVVRYIGITNDMELRQKQHNYLLLKGKNKLLYNNIRKMKINEPIKLELVRVLGSKVEARRYEALLILHDHFNNRLLWQRVPRISDV